MKSRGGASLSFCSTYDEVGIPFSSTNGLVVVDLTCALDPDDWTRSSEMVELEVRIHEEGDSDEYGTSTGIKTRLLSDGTAPKVFESGDSPYHSSVTRGWLTLRTDPAVNTWTINGTDDIVKAICSIEVQ